MKSYFESMANPALTNHYIYLHWVWYSHLATYYYGYPFIILAVLYYMVSCFICMLGKMIIYLIHVILSIHWKHWNQFEMPVQTFRYISKHSCSKRCFVKNIKDTFALCDYIGVTLGVQSYLILKFTISIVHQKMDKN